MRTRLNPFSNQEQGELVNWGYALADAAVRRYTPQLVTQTGIDWGQLTAIGTIVVIPMILAGLAVRRWLVTGLTLGAVTGE